MRSLLSAQALKVQRQNRWIWSISHLSLQVGDRVGLVGRNGSGKSLLLQHLAGLLEEVEGQVSRTAECLYLPQEVSLSKQPNLSPGQTQHRRLKEAFASKVPLLFLDEPTNHLDEAGRNWLLVQLKNFEGGCVIASHDRALLSQMTETWHLDHTLTRYSGSFRSYEIQRRNEVQAIERRYESLTSTLRQQKENEREVLQMQERRQARGLKNVEKMGLSRLAAGAAKRRAQNTKAKLQDVHETRVTHLQEKKREAFESLATPYEASWNLVSRRAKKNLLVQANDLVMGYETSFWEAPLHFTIHAGERIHLKGKNGSGKSTLLKAILGDHSQIWAGSLAHLYDKASHLNQILNSQSTDTMIEIFRATNPMKTEVELRNLLGRLGFKGDTHHQEFHSLSGGERVRLVIGSWQLSAPPDLIVLDEPENNLDLESLQLLESQLIAAPATLLVVSHDQSLIERLKVQKVIQLPSRY